MPRWRKWWRTILGKEPETSMESANTSIQQQIAQLNQQVVQLFQQGQYAQAIGLATQALELARSSLGEEHPDTGTTLNNLAGLYAATARPSAALPLMQRAAAITGKMIGQIFAIASESQRTAYLKTVEAQFEAFLSLVFRHLSPDPAAVRAALELVLRRKAIGAEALAAQRDAVLGGRYPHLELQLQQLTSLRNQIVQKRMPGPGPERLEAYNKLLAEWEAWKDRLEADLARQIPEMNLEQRLRNADREALARAMPPGVALVEVVRFDVFDFTAVPARGERRWQLARYLAFVVPAGEPDNVQMVDLGEAEEIDRLIEAFRDSLLRAGASRVGAGHQPAQAQSVTDGQALCAAVFNPQQVWIGREQGVELIHAIHVRKPVGLDKQF